VAGLPGLRPPRELILDGETYRLVDWSTAVDVLPAFEHQAWPLALLANVLDSRSSTRLLARCVDETDPLDLPDLHNIAARLVEVTFGQPYWVAGRLLGMAVTEWSRVDGVLLLRGVDLAALLESSPARAVSVLMALALEGRDDSDRHRIEFELRQPPATAPAEAELWTAEDEGASFLAAMAAR